MKRVLITGITGFVGQYLAEHLLAITADSEIHGTYHSEEGLTRLGSIQHSLHLHQVDLTNQEQVATLISEVQPQEVYHLAAKTSPAESFKNPADTLVSNTLSEVYLFEALRQNNLTDTRVVIVSTSEVYGMVKPEDLPIDEDTPLRPASPYAVSKISQDFLGYQYFLSYKMPIIRVRPFNHTGPRQSAKFVVPSFAKQIAEIEKGKKEPVMNVGTLTAKKDFTDVRDIVRAYALLMEKGEAGEVYNIGSGRAVSMQEILDHLLSLATVPISVQEDPALVRPIEIPELRADYTKASTAIGWRPEISLEQTLKDTLDYFRNLV